MLLTTEQESILKGEQGKTRQKAIRLLIDLGKAAKAKKLEKDLIREERSCGRTILCSRCEALIVITANNLIKVELSSINGDTIMLKEPHLIRKVTY